MKIIIAILVGLLFIWTIGLYCENQLLKTQVNYVPSITEQLKALQQQVGCTKIDAKIGPETTLLVNQAVKQEEWELFNSYAAVYMTPTGAPK